MPQPDFFEKNPTGQFFFFTTKGRQKHSDVRYPDGAFLVFGREDAGLPEELLKAHPDRCVRLPIRAEARSLNLSNTVAVGVFEALRQWDYPLLEWKGDLTRYRWDDEPEEST